MHALCKFTWRQSHFSFQTFSLSLSACVHINPLKPLEMLQYICQDCEWRCNATTCDVNRTTWVLVIVRLLLSVLAEELKAETSSEVCYCCCCQSESLWVGVVVELCRHRFTRKHGDDVFKPLKRAITSEPYRTLADMTVSVAV